MIATIAQNASAPVVICGADLSLLPGSKLEESGSVRVGAAANGCVTYGPGVRLLGDSYLVEFHGNVEVNNKPGFWELADIEHIYFRRPVRSFDNLIFIFSNTTELEIRLIGEGSAFEFKEVEFTALSAPIDLLTQKAIIFAVGGQADAAVSLISGLAKYGREADAAYLARSIAHACENLEIVSEIAWGLAHSKGMAEILKDFNPLSASSTLHPKVIGANPENVAAFKREGIAIPQALWTNRDRINRCEGLAGILPSGQDLVSVLSDRALAHSLWNENILTTRHAFAVSIDLANRSHVFYWFDDVEPWYAIANLQHTGCFDIYFPRRNLLISGCARGAWSDELSKVVGLFRTLMMADLSGCNAYFDKPTRPALLVGNDSSIGEFFRQQVQGVGNAINANVLSSGTPVVCADQSYLSVVELFPEQDWGEIYDVLSPEDLFFCGVENSLIYFQPSAPVLSSEMASTIAKTCVRTSSIEQRSLIVDLAQGPVIWFALRSVPMVLLNQISCVRTIADNLAGKFGGATILLSGDAGSSQIVSELFAGKMESDCRVSFVDITNLTIQDAAIWALAADAFVTTADSDLAYTSWIGRKPGVVHGASSYLRELEKWRSAAADLPPILTPDPLDVCLAPDLLGYTIDPRVLGVLTLRAIATSRRKGK